MTKSRPVDEMQTYAPPDRYVKGKTPMSACGQYAGARPQDMWNLSSACHPFSIQGSSRYAKACDLRRDHGEQMASVGSTGHRANYLKIRPRGMAESDIEIVAFDIEAP